MSLDARTEVRQLADVLLADVERIAERHVARMRELLPSYGEVPAEKLLPAGLTITRNLLEAVRDTDADPVRSERYFRVLAETRIDQGIAGDEMLQAWRILLEVVREAAHPAADRLGIADDALLEFVEATLQWGDVGMRKTASAYREAEMRELERLAAEQSALRRVATLVARGLGPGAVFGAVAEELHELFDADISAIVRFEADGTATVLGDRGGPHEAGARVTLDPDYVVASVLETRRAARFDTEDPAGTSGIARAEGIRSAVAGPIVVDGSLWGAVTAASLRAEPLPADAESRIGKFADLVATAVSNVQARAAEKRLTEEQAALRRVATLAVGGAPPTAVFDAVVAEMERLLRAGAVTLIRYEPADEVTFLAHRGPGGQLIPPGTRASHAGGESATAIVRRTQRPARHLHAEGAPGALAAIANEMGFRSSVGVPLVVEGDLWGCIVASWGNDAAPPIETEERMARFAQLLATAIANADSREALRRLAERQAALRRVATMVAQERPPEEVFAKVAEEVTLLLAAHVAGVWRYEPHGQATLVATSGDLGRALTVGSRWKVDGHSLTALVFRTERSARIDAYDQATGSIGEEMRRRGVRCTVGSPVFVSGRLWGVVGAASKTGLMPADAESQIVEFTDLVATAISNLEARSEVTRLADEQAALRRVATLVAEGARPTAVFEAVTFETRALMGADSARLLRYEADGTATFLAERNTGDKPVLVGTRLTLEGDSVTARVLATRRSCRINDLRQAEGAIAEIAHERDERAAVGAPIMVEGRLWGVLVAMWSRPEPPPEEAEARINEFAQLVATAMANADSKDQLTASRARLLTEADEARRRVVRDLHDGAQQRLLQTIVTLGLAQRALDPGSVNALITEALAHARQGNSELRELAHGILPAVLIQGGLRSGISSVVSRLDLPVDVDVPRDRFPVEVEASAYFVVAEALTNVVKHSHAERAEVSAFVKDKILCIEVRDDGVGGANPRGQGLVGLSDRVTALGGRLSVESIAGGGTILAATLPLNSR